MAASVISHEPMPRLLAWARRKSGLNVQAVTKKAKLREGQLEAFEKGTQLPTLPQLKKIATVYKRPLAFFFLPEVPKDFSPIRDNRVGSGFVSDPSLKLEIRRAHERREAALELATDGDAGRFRFEASKKESAEVVGARLRDILGVSIEAQLGWSDSRLAFNGWRRAAERAGVLVFETQKLDPAIARGFSLSEERFPVVVVNGQDAHVGRSFTIGHELAHIALRSGSVCGLEESNDVERFCNRVAAAMLLPEQAFREDEGVAQGGSWNLIRLNKLSNRFNVSPAVAAIRLNELGLLSVDALGTLMRAIPNEPKKKAKTKKGGPAYHLRVLKYNGRGYTQLVLAAYHQRAITLAKVSDYLGGIKVSHVPALEAALWRNAA